MLKLFPIVGAVALAAVSAIAQTVQVPPAATVSGYGTSINYFRAGTNKFQMVYDTSHFTGQGLLAPISITQIDFVFAPGSVFTAVNFPSVNAYVDLSLTDWTAQSTTYASNRTNPAAAPNFSGTVNTVAGAFYVSLPLSTPFSYDPTAGVDLVVEIDILAAPTPLTGNTQYCAYSGTATGVPPGNACSVVRSVGAPAALSGATSGFVPILQFTYTPAPGAGVATPIGAGCIEKYASFHEFFATTANFDLQNSAVTFLNAGSSYIVTRSGAWLPAGSVQATPTVLTLADDAEVNYPFTTGSFPGWTGLQVCSNAYVAAAAGNTLVAAPSVTTTMNAPQQAFYAQRDLDPSATTGGGVVQVEESAGVTTVSFIGVPNWTDPASTTPVTQPCDIQFQFYASGDVTIAFGANMSANQDNGGILVGYSPAGPNLNPPSTDISALTGGILLETADTQALKLESLNRPVINTTWNLNVTNIPPLVQVGVEIYGFSDPGINDLFPLGAPGCGLRANLDVLNPWISIGGTTHAYSLSVPNSPGLLGSTFFLQSAMLDASYNAFGAITSNGISGLIGSI
ncbi:MAG: hypothetical protein MUC36_18560 [Planctomycetes bacterium]|jgi:hypothetical protein|nr:hypothetical protein [Planctomycetota bacterium]